MGMVKQTAKLEVPKETKRELPPIPSVPTAVKQPSVSKKVETSQAVERAGDDKVLTQPKTRDRSIELQALLKSTLESPVMAQLTMGQDQVTAIRTLTVFFENIVKLYDSTK